MKIKTSHLFLLTILQLTFINIRNRTIGEIYFIVCYIKSTYKGLELLFNQNSYIQALKSSFTIRPPSGFE
jgi:hypothetical protein